MALYCGELRIGTPSDLIIEHVIPFLNSMDTSNDKVTAVNDLDDGWGTLTKKKETDEGYLGTAAKNAVITVP